MSRDSHAQRSPFTAATTLFVVAYRPAPETTGWYAKGTWTRQYRLHAVGCWTWVDWWRKADFGARPNSPGGTER